MQLAFLLLAIVLLVILANVVRRRDPDDAIAERLEHLAAPWRETAAREGFGFVARYDQPRRTYFLRGNRQGWAVTVEYSTNDLTERLGGGTPGPKVSSRVKVTVHLAGGLPEGIRIRHEPRGGFRPAGPDEILTGEGALDEELWISGAVPGVVRAFVRREQVRPLLRTMVQVADGALLTEYELMLTRVEAEDAAREQVPELVDTAVELARRLENAAVGGWRRVGERWEMELIPGSGGQPPMLVGSYDSADVRVELTGSGPCRQTLVTVGWNVGLPDGFRVTERSAPRGEAPEIPMGYPRVDKVVRVEGYEPRLFRTLLLEPAVIDALLAVVPGYGGASIDSYGVHIPLTGRADAETLSSALDAALTITRRLRRQLRAAARAVSH